MINKNLFSSQSATLHDFYRDIQSGLDVAVFGAQWADRTVYAANLDKFVYVCSDYVTALEAFRQISSLRDDAVYLPAKDDVLTYIRSRNDETAFARLTALFGILSGKFGAVVTSVEALMQLFPSKKSFLDNSLSLKVDEEYSQEILIECLVRSGYKRQTAISAKGQFSKRGDILDVSPINLDYGVRLEFFGDELESIKTIDFSTQKSQEKLDCVDIVPAAEFFPSTNNQKILDAMRADIPKKLENEAKTRINNIISEIEFKLEQGCTDTSLSYVLPYSLGDSFFSFASGFTLVLDDVKRLNSKIILGEHVNRCKQLLAKGEILPQSTFQIQENPFENTKRPPQNPLEITEKPTKNPLETTEKTPKNPFENTEKLPILGFYNNITANDIFVPEKTFSFHSVPIPNYSKDFEALVSDLILWTQKGMPVYLYAGSEQTRERLADRLREHNIYFGYDYKDDGCKIRLLADQLYKGAVLFEYNVVLIGTYDLIAKKSKKAIKRSKKEIFSQPQMGEYVVHEVHGIGVFESIQQMAIGGVKRDYLVIGYRDGDKLYIPVVNMDSLTKYSSGEESPRLSKIGGAEFAKVKDRARQSVKKMAFDLLKLYAERELEHGHKYLPFEDETEQFAKDFPYVETDDQLQAIEEGTADLLNGKIMDRLLCGDVGYGKTEVALRLAYNVILNGKQVAFVAPTTILARQHFATTKERMEKFGVCGVSLSRLNSPAQTKIALEKLADGTADIVCGTHRVLGKEVKFKNLGLLILDEEQRFGVADKEKIKLLKKNVCVLALSATPIPRTLHMSMAGIRDISILDTPPVDRIPVQTYVTEYSETLLVDAAFREINRGGQVFIVYNRVATIDSFAARVSEILGHEVSVIHGQMPEKQMEDALNTFILGETKVLIASTIIENGIDMPNANTMIVVDADRLGLSQLYQLRGRVGRSNRLSYVFFTYDESKVLTENACKRLESINEFTEFGSGFKIAMRDLQIRGAGNIIGREQHGHMEKIGYDMYLKILSEELEKLKGIEVKKRSEVKVAIDFDAFIPESYIPDPEWQLKVYSRMSHIETSEEINRLTAELEDIYGTVPASVVGLCKLALVKNLAANANAHSVSYKNSGYSLAYQKLIDIPASVVDKINSAKSCSLKLTPTPTIDFGKGKDGEKKLLEFLK